MAVLTWRNVDAPDFRSSMEGFKEFSNLLGGAFDGLKGGLKDFDNAKTDRVNADLLARAAAAQDANAADALTASLATDPNRDRFSATALQVAMGRHGNLAKQAETDYTFNRTKEHNAALDAARPDAVRLLNAYASGDDTTANEILGNSTTLRGLDINDLFNIAIKGQGLVKGDVGIAGDRQSQSQSGIRFNNEQTDRQEGREAIALEGVLRRNSIGKAGVEKFINDHYDDLLSQGFSPIVLEKARSGALNDPSLSPSFYNDGVGGGGAGAGIGGAALAMGYGGTPIPDSIQTVGDVIANKGALVADRGASPVGVYQINAGTWAEFAPQVLGSNWKNAPVRDFNTQDAVGKAIFESTKGDPKALMGRWASLSPAEAQAISKMPWEQARSVIAKGETGTNIQSLIAQHTQDVLAQAGPQYNRSQDEGQVTARAVAEAFSSDADIRTVAGKLTGDGGQLAGENIGNVAGLIKQVAQKYHTSPAVAGFIVARSVDANKNWYQRTGDNLAGIFGGGDGLTSHVDWDKINELGNLAGNQDALLRQLGASTINDASSQLAASAAQAAQAAQAQARAEQVAAARLGRNVDPSAALAQAAMAADTRNQALANAGAVTRAGARQQDEPPTIDQKAVPKHESSKADVPSDRKFGKYGIYVPEGKFKTQAELEAYVSRANHRIDAVKEARAITNLRGVIREAQRKEFIRRYNMSPEALLASKLGQDALKHYL